MGTGKLAFFDIKWLARTSLSLGWEGGFFSGALRGVGLLGLVCKGLALNETWV